MIIGILEYGEVRIYDSTEAALSEWGRFPSDLANHVIVLYDAQGTWLEPVFTLGSRRWLGLRDGAVTTTLRPNPAPDDFMEPIAVALRDAVKMVSNKHFQSLDELRRRYPEKIEESGSI